MKAGTEYELLIEQMYRQLEPNAIVTHDDHIYDAQAKTKRQIDVSIKYRFADVNHLIVVEVKDYKHKANISVVDSFQQVIEDVNANKGILICSKGFSKTAINKAESYGIDCLTVHSALNKNWETLLKIPVKKVTYEFTLKSDFILNIAHKAGKKVKMINDTFSYDGINIIDTTDIISDHILKKKNWKEIKKAKDIRLDLKSINLYHSFDNEMLPIVGGFIEIKYLKSHINKFYIEPKNYIYSSDQINHTNKLHNLTITQETLDLIANNEYENIKDINEPTIITATVLKFSNGMYQMSFQFNIKGGIEGKFYIKDNKIMKIDDRTKSIIELENILKNNKNASS